MFRLCSGMLNCKVVAHSSHSSVWEVQCAETIVSMGEHNRKDIPCLIIKVLTPFAVD
jgi:hypothetical protein